MKRALLSFDTDHIKEYVFASNALKEIRGASNILDRLNGTTMRQTVSGECIYAHGGSGLFIVPSDRVPDCIARTQQAYAEQTGHVATITGVALDLPPEFDLENDDIRPIWKHLSYKLQAAKTRNPLYCTSVTHPFLRYSDSDGTHYASEVDGDDSFRLISHANHLKIKRNQKIRHRATMQGQEIPKDFASIAAVSRPANYFALVYADGDGLGQVLDTCRTLPEIRKTAQGIDEILRQCKDEALAKYEVDTCSDTLLHGGDDLLLALPAHAALEVAIHISDTFRVRTQKTLGQAYTVSTAVVWAHPKFPFRSWFAMADSALKFAKREGVKRSCTGLINFLVISSANHLVFEQYYKDILVVEEAGYRLVRTLRPYTTTHLAQLISYRKQLAGISRSKLASLRNAAFLSQSRAMFEALRTLTHERSEERRRVIQKMVMTLGSENTETEAQMLFPFMKVVKNKGGLLHAELRTPMLDLAELWDFTDKG